MRMRARLDKLAAKLAPPPLPPFVIRMEGDDGRVERIVTIQPYYDRPATTTIEVVA